MLGFMDHVQNVYYAATGWDRDNSYGALTTTSRNLLDFDIPTGLRLNVSSLPSTNFANSYTLGSLGVLDGSVSFLYTSRALTDLPFASRLLDLPSLVPGYRHISNLQARVLNTSSKSRDVADNRRDTLLYGRLYLPMSTLEGLYMRRLSLQTQLKISSVSDFRLPNGGTVLAHLQRDTGQHSTEVIYSTDSALFGFRGLYNFGIDKAASKSQSQSRSFQYRSKSPAFAASTASTAHGQFSAGGEVYYGLLNKSGGLSLGLRFTTLPAHLGFPYTMTCTLNPLMGNISSTYSVVASSLLTLCSRLDFNVFSYESELQLGAELWRPQSHPDSKTNLSWARKKLGIQDAEIDAATPSRQGTNNSAGCLKARANQRGCVSLLWEGRIKDLLYTCGTTIDIKGGENMFRGLGLELHYSP